MMVSVVSVSDSTHNCTSMTSAALGRRCDDWWMEMGDDNVRRTDVCLYVCMHVYVGWVWVTLMYGGLMYVCMYVCMYVRMMDDDNACIHCRMMYV